MKYCFILLLLCALLPCSGRAEAISADAQATVVIYNDRDPVSITLAASYAQKRGIPFDHLVGLACSTEETISREEYLSSIAGPLRKALVDRGWWRVEPHPARYGEVRVVHSKLRYAVLMRGIPLRIGPQAEPIPGDRPERLPEPLRRNEAAVDSELALLGYSPEQVTGPADNPFFKSAAPALAGGFPPELLLVCRLDAATQFTVQRMIDDAVAAEKQGLWGFAYVDSRAITEGGYKEGDEWLRSAVGTLLRAGIPTIHEDSPELFPGHYPMQHAALYYGWYTEQIAGALTTPGFRFVPGAIALHIHSFSAATLRAEQHWCAPMLERGAAATLGNVFEPYLHFTTHADIFQERLLRGFTFAEAAYAATPALSWMNTFIGDPLYRPFKVRAAKGGLPGEFAAFRVASKGWFGKGRKGVQNALIKQGNAMKSGVIFEGLATLQLATRDPSGALESLLTARKYYTNENDQSRCAIQAAGLLANLRKQREAVDLLKTQIAATPGSVALPLMNRLIDLIIPKPQPPPQPAAR